MSQNFNNAPATIVVGGKQASGKPRLAEEDENNNRNEGHHLAGGGAPGPASNQNNCAHSQITLNTTASELSSSDEIAKFR